MNFKVKATTAFNLGLINLYRVVKYRISVKTGLNAVQKLSAPSLSGSFFASAVDPVKHPVSPPEELIAFSYLKYPINNPPSWFYSPLTNHTFKNTHQPWFSISDFDANVGDIKGIWEISRWDWLINFVKQERKLQDGCHLALIDTWLNDWCLHNPPYLGPNWKCGQEASIRVMHLVTTLIGLKQLEKPQTNVLKLIEIHLKRIAPTIDYAIAQDNNHGTSEATALFIGGELLAHFNKEQLEYQKWAKLGRKWLENRAVKLIMSDGGFSQYSSTYHRVMLDSYCLSEIVRLKLQLPLFSPKLYRQLKKATDWLYVLTQRNGDVPNLGANDGARLIPTTETDYRDFRPSIQLASNLFCSCSYYSDSGLYDQVLDYFGFNKKFPSSHNIIPNKNQFFKSSGLITEQNNNFFVAFKIPIYKFRPSQCDALHVDIWWHNYNILRDGGTFSYNSTVEDLNYFSGVCSHNTVQFDDHQQMPRLSRFLFGAWLKPINLFFKPHHFICAYKDLWNCTHQREIFISGKEINISDNISGFKRHAILRWRLMPDDWHLENNILTNGQLKIEIQCKESLNLKLVQGEESRYYYHKNIIPVLQITAFKPTTITTVIQDLI